MKKLILSSIIMTIIFLLAVVGYEGIKSLMVGANANLKFTGKEVQNAIIAESLRSIITSYLFTRYTIKKNVILEAIVFGLLCSALIGSIWIPLGIQYLNPESKLSFLINDSIILILQGILSGLVLWIVYRKKPVKNNI